MTYILSSEVRGLWVVQGKLFTDMDAPSSLFLNHTEGEKKESNHTPLVLGVALPHLAEELRQTVSIDAGRIRSLVVLIDGKLSAFEALVSAVEDQTGKKLECPTFNRQLLDQLKVEELVELRG